MDKLSLLIFIFLKKVQLLTEDSEDPEKLIPNDFYSYWNSKAGLKNISTFADGIG